MCDLQPVLVTCFGDSRLVTTYAELDFQWAFVKKEGQQMVLYITRIGKRFDGQLCLGLLTDIVSPPQSPPQQSVDEVPQD